MIIHYGHTLTPDVGHPRHRRALCGVIYTVGGDPYGTSRLELVTCPERLVSSTERLAFRKAAE